MLKLFNNNSWLSVRFSIILLSFFDFITLNILFFNLYNIENFINFATIFLYSSISIIFLYIFGRYTKNFTPTIREALDDIKIIFLSNIFSLILIHIIISLIEIFDYKILTIYQFTLTSIIFFFIAIFTNILFKNFSINYNFQDKYWITFLESKSLNDLQKSKSFTSPRFKIRYDYENYLELAKKNKIAGVIYDEKYLKINKYKNLIDICIKNKTRFLTIEKWNENIINFFSEEYIYNYISTNSLLLNQNLFAKIIKRVMDIVLSLILIVLTSPLIILTSIIIFLEDKNSIFYFQQRNGLDNKSFKIIKFRSMKKDAEIGGPSWAYKNDPRVTKIGRIIRKYRIDELPQLICVLKGEMSLIGPRPERGIIDNQLIKLIPKYNLRYKLKPGLTGWAQVNFSYGASVDDSKIKLGFDLFYIRNFSILLDFFILLKTIKIVLKGNNSVPK